MAGKVKIHSATTSDEILLHYKRIYSDQNFTKAAKNDLKMDKSGLVSGSGRFLDAPPHDSLLMETKQKTNQFSNI